MDEKAVLAGTPGVVGFKTSYPVWVILFIRRRLVFVLVISLV